MAMTSDDIRNLRQKGKGASSFSSSVSNKVTADDIAKMRKPQSQTATVQSATTVQPAQPQTTYGSLAEYDKALEKMKMSTLENLAYKGKSAAQGVAQVANGVIGTLMPRTQKNFGIDVASALPDALQYSEEENAYKELEKERNVYAQEHMWDEYADLANNSDYAQKSKTVNLDDYMGMVEQAKYSQDYIKLNEEQRAMANYILNTTGNKDKAMEFVKNISQYNDRQKLENATDAVNAWEDTGSGVEKFGKNALVSAGTAVGNVVTSPFTLIQRATSADYNPYEGAAFVSSLSSKLREGVTENIEEAVQPSWTILGQNPVSFAYNTAMSVAESWMGAKSFGKGYSAFMGASAYNDTYRELKESGANEVDAMIGAGLTGVFETLFEEVSLENLLSEKSIVNWKTWVAETLKQAGVEASEETFTELADVFANEFAMGATSDIQNRISELKSAGYGDKQIKEMLAQEMSYKILGAALGGALSGGLMGGMQNGIQGKILKDAGISTNLDSMRNAVKDTEFATELESLESEYDGRKKTGDYYGRLGDIYSRAVTDSANAVNSSLNEKENSEDTEKAMSRYAELIRSQKSEEAVKAEKKANKFNIGKETTVNGETAKIQSVSVENGKVTVQTDKGEFNVKDSSIKLSTSDAEVVAMAADMTDKGKADAFVKNYKGETIADYERAFNVAYTMGKGNYTMDELTQFMNETDINNDALIGAYESGKASVKIASDNLNATREKFIKEWNGKYKSGTFDTSGIDGMTLTNEETALKNIAESFSLLGINVKLIKDTASTSINGNYDAVNNTVTFNLAARFTADGNQFDRRYVLNTMAHELTHWMEDKAPKEYKELQEFIFNYFGEKKVKDLVASEQRKYEKNHGATLSEKDAKSEVMARACEDMLSDAKVLQNVLSGASNNFIKRLETKMKQFFKEMGEFISNLMDGYHSFTDAAQILGTSLKALNTAKGMWEKAFTQALKYNQVVSEHLNKVGLEVDDNGYVYESLNSEKTFRESDYSTDIKTAAKDLSKMMEISETEAEIYIKNVGSIANKIAKDRDRLDYISIEGKSAWVANSDYGGSLDYSFLCPKRLTYTGTMNAILAKQNDLIFSVDDFLFLRKSLIEAGYDAPCSFCYVESARARFGKYNTQFMEIAKAEGLYVPTAEELTNPDELERLKKEHRDTFNRYEKYLNSLSQRKPKMLEERRPYNGDILKAFKGKEDTIYLKNIHGGIRFNSFSDFEVVHMIDCMQAILDMSRVGLAGFGYTKQKAFAEVFGNTGLKINLSCVAKGIDANGRIIFDDVEGMNSSDALKLRNGNVGICCVVFTDAQLKAALCDSRIDYVLPFHRSQWSKKEYERMGLSLDTKDFTKNQTEKLGTKKAPDGNIPFLNYWNSNQNGEETVQKYLDIINASGKTPLFPQVLEKNADGLWIMPKGKKDSKGRYINQSERIKEEAGKNYWKVLCEFKLYDSNGKGLPQTAVTPNFNMKAANKILKEYDGSHKEFPVAQNVVDDFLNYKKTGKSSIIKEWDGKTLYSLKEVDEVKPSSSLWSRTATTSEAREIYPKLWSVDADESETRNPTQVTNTISSYRKVYEYLKENGFQGSILDASSGLGLGTELGRNEYGYTVDDIEPYPSEDYKPKYTDYSKLHKKYDFIINNAVLNVLPQDQRDGLAIKMGELLKVGGKALISVRTKNDVNQLGKNSKNIRLGDAEYIETTRGSYQKGFTPTELKAYLEDCLGYGFTVEVTKMLNGATVIVTKNSEMKYSDKDSDGNVLSQSQIKFFKDSKVRDDAGNLLVVYHTSPNQFTVFDKSKKGDTTEAPNTYAGFFFTNNAEYFDNKAWDGQFGKNKSAYYLNIKNPINFDDISRNAFADIIEVFGGSREDAFNVWDKEKALEVDRARVRGSKNTAVSLENVYETLTGEMFDETEFYETLEPMYDKLMAKGYDGIINSLDGPGYSKEYIILNSNQAKLTSNVNPTENEDVRYSDKDLDGYVKITSDKLGFTDERIDEMLSSSYYGSSDKNYAQAYITYMSPATFLSLTSGKNNPARVERLKDWNTGEGHPRGESFSFDKMAEKYTKYPIKLDIDETGNFVYGHEGRHRMNQLAAMGYNQIPVLVFNMDNKYSKKFISSIDLMPQRISSMDDEFTEEDRVTIKELIPFNQGNRELIKQKFGSGSGATLFSYKDSEGNTLTREQAEFFKDSKARDSKGNLLKMWHGSYSEFNVFESNDWVKEENGNNLIKGYFDTNKEYSDIYGDIVKSYYLNVKNPLYINPDKRMSISDWENYFADLGINGIKLDSSIATDTLKGYIENDGNRTYIPWEIFDRGDYWNNDGNLTRKLADAGYDAVMWNEGMEDDDIAIMPFNANAIKLTDNLKPTEDSDIRYSDKDSSGKQLSKEQIEFFKESKVRNGNGNLLRVYHGSSSPNKFTTFDLNARGEVNGRVLGDGFYFTPDKNTASKWSSENIYSAYLNITNPYYASADDEIPTEVMEYLKKKLGTTYDSLVNEKVGNEPWWGSEYSREEYIDSESSRLYKNAEDAITWISNDSAEKTKILKSLGYDGIIYKKSSENFSMFGGEQYVAFDANQIKDVANKKPTSSDNILYSEKETEALDLFGENKRLKKENETLKADLEKLKEMLKLDKTITKGKVLKESNLEAVAKGLLKSGRSTTDIAVVIDGLKEVYGYILDNSSEKDKQVDYNTMMGMAYELAKKILKNSQGLKFTDSYYKEILTGMRKSRIKFDSQQIQEAKSMYGDRYRDAFMGTVILAKDGISLDSLWQDWAESYPGIFDADINSADMPSELLYIAENLRKLAVQQENLNTAENAMYLAQEIYDRFWNVATVTTTADKLSEKYKKMHAESMAKVKSSAKEAMKKKDLADKMYYGRVLNAQKEKAKADQKELKEYIKKKEAKRKDAAVRRASIEKITDVAMTLSKWLKSNTAKEHIIEPLKVPVGRLVESLDYSSKRVLGLTGGDKKFVPTQKDLSVVSSLSDVRDIINKVNASQNGDGELTLGTWIDFTPEIAQKFDDIYKYVDKLSRQYSGADGSNILQLMSTEWLEELADSMKMLMTVVRQANRYVGESNAHSMDDDGNDTIKYAGEMKARPIVGKDDKLAKRAYRQTADSVSDFMDFSNALPWYVFKRLGKGAQRRFKSLMDGQDRLALDLATISEFTKTVYTEEEIKEWQSDVRTITIHEMPTEEERQSGKNTDRTVHMTVGQLMALYCLSKREQAQEHIKGGGIEISEFKKGGLPLVSKQQTVTIVDSELKRILSEELNERQIEVADTLQKYMSSDCSEWGNEVSMQRFGIRLFTEENYFPIQVSSNALNVEVKDTTKSLYALLNMGFTKPLTQHANNPLVINDIFEVFAAHTSDMAKYHSMALPVLNMVKWFNYKDKIEREEGAYKSISVKESLETTYGRAATKYIRSLLYDLNGTSQIGRNENFAKRLTKTYKASAVAGNLQVGLLQPLSYIRANAVMNPKYLTKALTRKPSIEKCQQNSGIAMWKSLGFYNMDVSRNFEQIITHNKTSIDKLVDKTMWLAETMDNITWGYIWNACEYEIMETNPKLAYNSKEFNEKVAERFREVIYSSQVVDSTLTRSDLMRSDSVAVQWETAFMSEPTVSINMLNDLKTSFLDEVKRTGDKSGALKKYGGKISRVVAVYALSSVVESLLRAGIYKWRNIGDDDDDTYLEKFLENLRGELNPLEKIPLVKELFNLFDGYSVTRTDTESLESLVKSLQSIDKVVTGEENWSYKTTYKLLVAISQMTGVPASSILREVTPIWNATIGMAFPSMRWEK